MSVASHPYHSQLRNQQLKAETRQAHEALAAERQAHISTERQAQELLAAERERAVGSLSALEGEVLRLGYAVRGQQGAAVRVVGKR